MLGRALMVLICIFHMLELLFRALFEVIDGKANGPESYTGPIGKKNSLRTYYYLENIIHRKCSL